MSVASGFLRVTLAIGAVLYLAIVAYYYFAQRSLLFARPLPRPIEIAGARQLHLRDSRHRPVLAVTVAGQPGSPLIVHFHGNAEQLADLAELAAAEHAAGFSFLAVEYPGYGQLERLQPSESAIDDAAETVLSTGDVERGLVVLQGQSLGSGVAARMAFRGFGRALVLISPYTSIADLAQRSYPWLPAKWILRDRFDTASIAPKIAIPTLILHGGNDEIIPLAMGERLAELFPNARLRIIRQAHHNDMLHDYRDPVIGSISEFVDGVMKASRADAERSR